MPPESPSKILPRRLWQRSGYGPDAAYLRMICERSNEPKPEKYK